MLHGSVVVCKESLVDLTKLGENVLSASGKASRHSTLAQGAYSDFLCVLLTASYIKLIRGAEGGSLSFGAKVAAGRTYVVFKDQSLRTPTYGP